MTTSFSIQPPRRTRFEILRTFYLRTLSAIKIQRWWKNLKSRPT